MQIPNIGINSNTATPQAKMQPYSDLSLKAKSDSFTFTGAECKTVSKFGAIFRTLLKKEMPALIDYEKLLENRIPNIEIKNIVQYLEKLRNEGKKIPENHLLKPGEGKHSLFWEKDAKGTWINVSEFDEFGDICSVKYFNPKKPEILTKHIDFVDKSRIFAININTHDGNPLEQMIVNRNQKSIDTYVKYDEKTGKKVLSIDTFMGQDKNGFDIIEYDKKTGEQLRKFYLPRNVKNA